MIPVELYLGVPCHIALVVDDVAAVREPLEAAGIRWSTVEHPVARLLSDDGQLSEIQVAYVASSGGEPRLKLISAVEGTLFAGGECTVIHHLSYWVSDIAAVTTMLCAESWKIEATGLAEDGSVSYRYLLGPGEARIELGLESNRADFDEWADGRASTHSGNSRLSEQTDDV